MFGLRDLACTLTMLWEVGLTEFISQVTALELPGALRRAEGHTTGLGPNSDVSGSTAPEHPLNYLKKRAPFSNPTCLAQSGHRAGLHLIDAPMQRKSVLTTERTTENVVTKSSKLHVPTTSQDVDSWSTHTSVYLVFTGLSKTYSNQPRRLPGLSISPLSLSD